MLWGGGGHNGLFLDGKGTTACCVGQGMIAVRRAQTGVSDPSPDPDPGCSLNADQGGDYMPLSAKKHWKIRKFV
jgi:hypothetical protein